MLLQKFSGDNVNISSKLLTRVTQLPYNVNPSYLRYKTNEIVTTVVEESDLTTPGRVRWWIYVLAILAGILLLLLLIYALYKVRKLLQHIFTTLRLIHLQSLFNISVRIFQTKTSSPRTRQPATSSQWLSPRR